MRIVFDADGSIFCAKVRDGKHEYRKVTCECSKKEIQESMQLQIICNVHC